MSGIRKSLAILAMGAMGAVGMMQPSMTRATEATTQSAMIRKLRLARIYYGMEFGYPDGPGWSNRHVKRMADKARNIKRNRNAHKGIK